MKHSRSDYDAIQPWPTKRPHFAKIDGKTMTVPLEEPFARMVTPLIGDDEPVFLLRAKDLLAPDAVRYWANAVKANGGDPDLADSVHRFADEMEDWGNDNGGHLPDTPAEYLKS